MDSIKATPRNEALGRLADLLTRGKTAANQYQILPQVPLIGGTGLGDLFMGKAPELLDDVSYDGIRAALRGGNLATGGIGTYGARPAVGDAALLGMDVAGLGKGLGGLSKKSASVLYDKLMEGGTSLSRRDALKKLGAISGSAAVAGTGVGALRKLSDNVVSDLTHVAPKIADNVAATTAKNYKFNTLADYLSYVRQMGKDTAKDMFNDYDIIHKNAQTGVPGYEPMWFSESSRAEDLKHTINGEVKRLLDSDSALYETRKQKFGPNGSLDPEVYNLSPAQQKEYEQFLLQKNEFSPQAKQEMKDWKTGVQKMNDDYGTNSGQHPDWSQWVINSNNDTDTLQFLRDYVKDVSF